MWDLDQFWCIVGDKIIRSLLVVTTILSSIRFYINIYYIETRLIQVGISSKKNKIVFVQFFSLEVEHFYVLAQFDTTYVFI